MTSSRGQSFLRLVPGLALVAVAAAGGAYALLNREPGFSVLDGAERPTIAKPTAGEVLDKSWMARFDAFMDGRLPARATMLEIRAAVVVRAFRDPIINDVYVDGPHGQLLDMPPRLTIRESLAAEAQALAQVSPHVPTLFVYVPRKEEILADGVPAGWPSDYPAAHAAIAEAWSGAGEFLDLTDDMKVRAEAGDAFFAADHHWTPAAARAAADAVADELTAKGVQLGTDPRTYAPRTAASVFYGSTGRAVTAGAAPPDVLTYPAPEGGFRATMCVDGDCGLPTIDESIRDHPGKYANRYQMFLGGDTGMITITNDSPSAHGTVLLLKDSFGNAFATYLAERVSELVVIDERHYQGPPLDELASELRPDAVVALHNPWSLLSRSFDPSVWTVRGDVELVEPKVFERVAVVTPQGLMLEVGPRQTFDPTLADDARRLRDAIRATGAAQVWFVAPRKEMVFEDLMPADVPNPVVSNSASVVEALSKAVGAEDLTALLSDPAHRDDYYFRTDHHWTIDGAKVAVDRIATRLEGAGVELGADDRAWNRGVGKLPFYGSEALLVPATEPVIPDDLVYETPEGGFRATMCFVADDCGLSPLNRDWLTNPQREANRYRAFLGGTSGLMPFHNDDPAARGTIVILSDSFGAWPAARLAERATDVYFIDERKWTGGPVARFVEKVDADGVVVLHNPVTLLSRAFDRDVWRSAGE